MSLFANMRLRGKLYSGFGFVILLTIVVAGMAIYSMMTTNAMEREVNRMIHDDMSSTYQVFNNYNKVNRWLQQIQVRPSPKLVREGLQDVQTLRSSLNQIHLNIEPQYARAAKDELEKLCALILGTSFEQALTEGDYNSARYQYQSTVLPQNSDAYLALGTLITSYTNHVAEEVSKLDNTGQIVQQLHLLGGCVNFLAVHGQLKGIHVDNQLVKDQTAGLLFCSDTTAAAQNRFDSGQNFLHFKGFGNVIVGAGFETRHLVVGFSLGSEHDDGSLRLGPDGLAHRPAVHHRHHHIQQYQIGLDGPELAQTLTAIGGNGNGVALLFQVHLQQFSNITVVLNNQNGDSHEKIPPFLFLFFFPYYTAKMEGGVNNL